MRPCRRHRRLFCGGQTKANTHTHHAYHKGSQAHEPNLDYVRTALYMTRLITFRFPKIKRRKKQPKYRRTSECVPKGNNSTHISYIPCELMRIHVRSRVRVFHVRAFHMCILLLLCCCCEGGRDDIVDSTHHRCLHECVFQILCCVL